MASDIAMNAADRRIRFDGWSDTHHIIASPCWCARMTGYRRNFTFGAASSSNGRKMFSKVMGFERAQPIPRALADNSPGANRQ